MNVKTRARPKPAVADAPTPRRPEWQTLQQAAERASERLNRKVTVSAVRFWPGLEYRLILGKRQLKAEEFDAHLDRVIDQAPRGVQTNTRGQIPQK